MSNSLVFATRLTTQLAKVGIKRVKPYQLDKLDNQLIEELMRKLHAMQTINTLLHYCAENQDYKSKQNNCVHTKVLELALGNNKISIRFQSV